MRILLDMDGVLADFMGGTMKLHGHTIEAYLDAQKARPVPYNVAGWLDYMDGVSRPNPWVANSWFERLVQRNAVNIRFWARLELYPWAEAVSYTHLTLPTNREV